MKYLVLAAAVLLSASLQAAKPKPDPILIYVGAKPPTNAQGFVDIDKDTLDSIYDLRDRVWAIKGVQLEDDPERADLRLYVLGRGVGSQQLGQLVQFNEWTRSIIATPTFQNDYWVQTVLEAGDYRKGFLGQASNRSRYSAGAWRNCAKQIAKNVTVWLDANRDQVRQRRQH